MELSEREKIILTLMRNTALDGFLVGARKYVAYSEKEIQECIEKFIKLGLVEIRSLTSQGETIVYYAYTEKVTQEMLSTDVRYKKSSKKD